VQQQLLIHITCTNKFLIIHINWKIPAWCSDAWHQLLTLSTLKPYAVALQLLCIVTALMFYSFKVLVSSSVQEINVFSESRASPCMMHAVLSRDSSTLQICMLLFLNKFGTRICVFGPWDYIEKQIEKKHSTVMPLLQLTYYNRLHIILYLCLYSLSLPHIMHR
jgi:hypothetical protein